MNKLITITIEQYADLLKTEDKYNSLKKRLGFATRAFEIDKEVIESYNDEEIVKKLGCDYEETEED